MVVAPIFFVLTCFALRYSYFLILFYMSVVWYNLKKDQCQQGKYPVSI